MKLTTLLAGLLATGTLNAQTNPAITSWIRNTTNAKARHYVSGNSTPIQDTGSVNAQLVRYSANYAYINSSGLPSYIVGPYQDMNPALATNRAWLFKIPLNPEQNTGTKTSTGGGQIGVLINGVPIYDYRDGRSYNNQNVWHQDAVFFEKIGFDCAKGHPSPVFSGGGPGQGTLVGGSYHHHQNPSAFNLDKVKISNVCDVYLADGLYVMDSTKHSPLLGFAFDGFPIYGAYGYANTDGTGGIKRMVSGYKKRNITDRTTLPNGSTASSAGPAISSTYPLGAYKEDYIFNPSTGDLDIHNGRFCKTPEYPNGIYAYFTTVDENQNSAYPYIIGETYYGKVEASNLPSMGQNGTSVVVSETVTVYSPNTGKNEIKAEDLKVVAYPNPASEFVAIQVSTVQKSDLKIELYDMSGKLIQTGKIPVGSTIAHLDTRTLYNGTYLVKLSSEQAAYTAKVQISR